MISMDGFEAGGHPGEDDVREEWYVKLMVHSGYQLDSVSSIAPKVADTVHSIGSMRHC